MLLPYLFFANMAANLDRRSSQPAATVCGKSIYGDAKTPFLYNANAWNPKSPNSGFVCVRVDESTTTNSDAPSFAATWNWSQDINDVYAFPYVRFNSEALPMRLSQLDGIRLATSWSMAAGDDDAKSTGEALRALDEGKVQANAAWDFFLDSDQTKSMSAPDAAVELMVWMGSVGDPWWLGRDTNTMLTNITLGDTEFSLYYGRNSGGTHVFTAVPSDGQDVLSIDADFSPLFSYLLNDAPSHPDTPNDLPTDPYLGVVEFGSETWYSDGNVTFSASNYSMALRQAGTNTSTTDDTDDDDGESVAASLGIAPLGLVLTWSLLIGGLVM